MHTPLDPYEQALLHARRIAFELEDRSIGDIERSLRRFANRLADGIYDLPPQRQAAAGEAVEVIESARVQLLRELSVDVDGNRSLTFEQVMATWQDAGREAARRAGTSGLYAAQLHAPQLTMLGAFEAIGGAPTWRTLLDRYTGEAADEAAEVVRQGILNGIGRDDLARELRKYVQGSEAFEKYIEDGKIDLRKVPKHLRGAAKKMRHNARRIAVSEIHNARGEAELQHFARDPMVEAIEWRLAPDRGSQKRPDQCDVMADSDLYGLGTGIFPVDEVPPKLHPFCRCEYFPVTRSWDDTALPKPTARDTTISGPPLEADLSKIGSPRLAQLSPDARERVRAYAKRSIRFAQDRMAKAASRLPSFDLDAPRSMSAHFIDMLETRSGRPQVPQYATSDARRRAKEELVNRIGDRMSAPPEEIIDLMRDIDATVGSLRYEDEFVAAVDQLEELGYSIRGTSLAEKVDRMDELFFNAIRNRDDVVASDLRDLLRDSSILQRTARRATADRLIKVWSESSANKHVIAHALQRAAREEFVLADAAIDHFDKPTWQASRSVYKRWEFELRDFVQVQYDETQAWLSSRLPDADHITLFRGSKFRGFLPDWAPDVVDGVRLGQGKETAILQPMSSFSTEPMVSANTFASGFGSQHGILTVARVPRKSVLGTCRTGYGCLTEAEAVVLGHPTDVVNINLHSRRWQDAVVKAARELGTYRESAVTGVPEVSTMMSDRDTVHRAIEVILDQEGAL